MKIKEIRAVAVDIRPNQTTQPRVPRQENVPEWVSPMKRYPDYARPDWQPGGNWTRTACIVTAEDGTWGFGLTVHSGPVTTIINDHFGKILVGENCMATEKMWDIMQRSSSPYGTAGLASFAISAVDNALWDLKGKLLGLPVYELLGGPQKEKIFCYASNTDISYGTENSLCASSIRCNSRPSIKSPHR